MSNKRVGIIGARGHTGAELLTLLDRHAYCDIALASSRAHDGQPVAQHVPGFAGKLAFCNVSAGELSGHDLDVLILALPNQLAAPYVKAWRTSGHTGLIIDLSADYRFDSLWDYGLPELHREPLRTSTQIANPGCYATAMQLALAPVIDDIEGTPVCFGVSGYSGAGTAASDKNNPALLADNLMPYASFDHIHEREVSAHLNKRVRFVPHVAAFFRGISVTATAHLNSELSLEELKTRYYDHYTDEPLVRLQDEIPWVRDVAGHHHACVGGWQVRQETREVVIYATLDNLLKGAATQAVQNLNLACGFNELEGIAGD